MQVGEKFSSEKIVIYKTLLLANYKTFIMPTTFLKKNRVCFIPAGPCFFKQSTKTCLQFINQGRTGNCLSG
ncbi:MAG: hypothetical protein C4308_11415 [Chitinophagaceae bacterium]